MAGVTLYFLVGFLLMGFLFKLVLANFQIKFYFLTKALVSALIIGKVIVVLRKTPLHNPFPLARGYVCILYRSFFFTVGIYLAIIIERSIKSYLKVEDWEMAISNTLARASMDRIIALTVCAFLLVLVHNVFEEIREKIGHEKIMEVLLGKRS